MPLVAAEPPLICPIKERDVVSVMIEGNGKGETKINGGEPVKKKQSLFAQRKGANKTGTT